MGIKSEIDALRYGGAVLGIRVFKPAVADFVNTAFANLFVITGVVLVTSVIGIRTVVQAGGASNIRFRHAGAANTVISAATATTATDAVGTLYSITGNFTDNVLIGAGGVGGSVPVQGGIAGGPSTAEQYQKGILINGGAIQVSFSAAAGTGSCSWTLHYVPVSDGASIAVG